MVISAKRELQLEQHPVDGSMVSQKNKNKTKTKKHRTLFKCLVVLALEH